MVVQAIERDERTVAVENASYRWAFLFVSFGLLICAAYRAFVFDQSCWDLLLLVVLGGGVGVVYQSWQRVYTQRFMWYAVLAIVVACLLAVAVVLVRSLAAGR
jgi:hypothetical protein